MTLLIMQHILDWYGNISVGNVRLTGLGIVLTVNTDLIPNPGDGFVNAISVKTGRELGRIKNIVDIACVLISITIGLFYRKLRKL